MESYIQLTENYLRMIQGFLTEDELKKSAKAGDEMHEEIARITEKYDLTIKEMLHATIGVHYSIMKSSDDQLEEYKVKEAKQYE